MDTLFDFPFEDPRPRGPHCTWSIGQTVPTSGLWVDQYGATSRNYAGNTFAPRGRGRRGPAYRRLVA